MFFLRSASMDRTSHYAICFGDQPTIAAVFAPEALGS
jgi:hypothetical protein